MAAAEEAAHAAKEQADAQLAAQQGAYEQVAAQKAAYDQQLQAAQIRLLELQGARNAYDQWVAQRAAEEAAARAAAEKAARDAAAAAAAAAEQRHQGGGGGRWRRRRQRRLRRAGLRPRLQLLRRRWGVTHYGVDIAAPIGTPIYAVTSGVVAARRCATGFGLAVYILGDDGAVTVYGHVNRYFVSVGERVSAGEQIAEVGNRGSRPARTCTSRSTPAAAVQQPGQPGAVAQRPGRVPRRLRRPARRTLRTQLRPATSGMGGGPSLRGRPFSAGR